MPQHKVEIDFHGNKYSLETGRFAKFANGAVMVSCGDTMVLVTAVASEEQKPDIDFLPLQVEYREKAAASGKFPGGFLKRESKPSDHEILCSRLIDRPIRPLFPKNWHYETQIIATVYSCDLKIDPDTIAAVGASAALLISDIPFAGPISEVKVGKVDGKLIINPDYETLEHSTIDITVAGTDTSIVMVEGECKEISEEEFLEALEFAHQNIKILNDLQKELLKLSSKPKREIIEDSIPEDLQNLINETITPQLNEFIHKITSKAERTAFRNEIYELALAKSQEKFPEDERFIDGKLEKYISELIHDIEKKLMREMILNEKRRLDGRGLTDIRPISCEVGLLPRNHGSALFTRGETQSLTSVTLGTKQDEQLIDGLRPTYSQTFILHYNFPPFSTGEIGRLTGVGRREIGHGNLAERALKAMLPSHDDFPYTIRVVSDILESNGSSSMATVCAGSLALFDAGVPMKKAVAGIAMGLIKEDEKIAILSDILGDEDHLGDMDFKVAGTVEGITACQMDIKIEGLSIEIMKQALEQARLGRLHILNIMNQTIDKPRAEISKYAPRFTIINIPPDTIGTVIGTGGENIKYIIKETGAEIAIDNDGTVIISSNSEESANQAKKMIESIIKKPEEGETYFGVIKEIKEGLGAIIEFLPKKQGLLHISQISHERTNNISDILKVGDKIEVKLIEVTPEGKFRLSRKALIPNPNKDTEKKQSENKDYKRRTSPPPRPRRY